MKSRWGGFLLLLSATASALSAADSQTCLIADASTASPLENTAVGINAKPCFRYGPGDLYRWRLGATFSYQARPDFAFAIGFRHEERSDLSDFWERMTWQELTWAHPLFSGVGRVGLRLEQKTTRDRHQTRYVRFGVGVTENINDALRLSTSVELKIKNGAGSGRESGLDEFVVSGGIHAPLSRQLDARLRYEYKEKIQGPRGESHEVSLMLIWSGGGLRLYREDGF